MSYSNIKENPYKVNMYFRGAKAHGYYSTMRELLEAWNLYRDGDNKIGMWFGASDMLKGCGDIYCKGKKVAYVSYNGRLWLPDPKAEHGYSPYNLVEGRA
jgi:hypothetical protein